LALPNILELNIHLAPINISPEGRECTYDALESVKQRLMVNTVVEDGAFGKKERPIWNSGDLKIPTTGDGSPSLLLHGLGDLTESPVVMNLFRVAGVR
jgi:hypothetical protein